MIYITDGVDGVEFVRHNLCNKARSIHLWSVDDAKTFLDFTAKDLKTNILTFLEVFVHAWLGPPRKWSYTKSKNAVHVLRPFVQNPHNIPGFYSFLSLDDVLRVHGYVAAAVVELEGLTNDDVIVDAIKYLDTSFDDPLDEYVSQLKSTQLNSTHPITNSIQLNQLINKWRRRVPQVSREGWHGGEPHGPTLTLKTPSTTQQCNQKATNYNTNENVL